MLPLMSEILRVNRLILNDYAEPYAGGCGLALSLLFGGFVSEIHINDIDSAIWSFWHSILEQTDEFVLLVKQTPISVAEWHKQRNILLRNDITNPLALGFATFFLNRTNRSGIIKGAGVIGGLSQTGKYKMDCRFNSADLAKRIVRISKYKSRIHLYNLDAAEFIGNDKFFQSPTFFCIDPPYYNKGSSLYMSFYAPSDHEHVAKSIMSLDQPWVVTYDKTDHIQSLYKSQRQYEFDINYSVQTKRVGTELLIASKGLRIPPEVKKRQVRIAKAAAAS